MTQCLLALAAVAGACISATRVAAESNLSEVIVVAPDPQASEVGSNPAQFYVARNGGKLDVPLVVSYTLTGSASNGGDYASVPLTLTLRANEPMGIVTISPIADASAEGTESVVFTLVPKPGTYTIGTDRIATASIADATGSSGKPSPKPGTPASGGTVGGGGAGGSTTPPGEPAQPVPPADFDPSSRLPPPDRTGNLAVTVSFHAAGKWVSKNTPGVYSNLEWRRSYSYNLPLRGTYSPGSGFQEIDSQQKGGMFVPNFKRYLVFKPRDFLGAAGRVCGKGDSMIQDDEVGVAQGDPGMPSLVPFTRIKKGGGVFPSGDKTVPERNLCFSDVTIDYEKNMFHLRIDGSDAHVKVQTTLNGKEVGHPFNVRLQGDATTSTVKSKLTFLNVPMPKNPTQGIDGQRVIENFSYVLGPDNTQYPLSATVTWKVTWK
jgi:hypothetical protein